MWDAPILASKFLPVEIIMKSERAMSTLQFLDNSQLGAQRRPCQKLRGARVSFSFHFDLSTLIFAVIFCLS
jgi:hypothetical protein